jgi:glycosyltransferase involved in cell wall biosynthesis
LRIVHVTSAHQRGDVRIFHKMCRSLSDRGDDVSLVVADGLGCQEIDGVKIIDVGISKGKLDRVFRVVPLMYKKVSKLDSCVVHLHDPELLTIAKKLKSKDRRVIYDSHEDLPVQILHKQYLTRGILTLLSTVIAWYQNRVLRQIDGVIAATPLICHKLAISNNNCVDVNNFPVYSSVSAGKRDNQSRNSVCYVGGITRVRGIKQMVEALQYCDKEISLIICGAFESPELEFEIKALPAWNRVIYEGYVDRQGVEYALSRSFAGLVTLHPISNYLDSLPVKMFEYMSAGIPVIASNFNYWRPFVQSPDCGLMVDPLNVREIASAINDLFSNQEKAQVMGANGYDSVKRMYNWDIEKLKLFKIYDVILGKRT